GVPFGGLTSVESLEDALVLSAEHSFDAVLTELCLPDACGLDAVTRLRQHNVQTPIVVLVPEEDAAFADQALHAGAQDVLSAGEIDGPALLRRLRHARQRQRAQGHLHKGALLDELTRLAKRTLLYQR